MLDPTKYYNSDTDYVQGNPNIGNERTHILSLTCQQQIKGSYLSASVAYAYMADAIGPVYALSDPNLQTWDNIGNSSQVSLALGLYSSFFDRKVSLNLSGRVGYIDNKISQMHRHTARTLGGRGLFYRSTLNVSYTTSKDWTYSIYAQWQGRSIGFSARQDKAPYVYFDVDKDIIRDKLSLSLSVLNPWGRVKDQTYFFFRDIEQSQSWLRDNSSMVRLGVTYTFGKSFRARQTNDIIDQDDRKSK